jgi:hypothetical protein
VIVKQFRKELFADLKEEKLSTNTKCCLLTVSSILEYRFAFANLRSIPKPHFRAFAKC